YSRALTRTTCPGALNSGLCAPWQLPATGGATAVSSPDPRCRPRPHKHPLYTGTAPWPHAPGRPLPLGNPPDAPVPPPAALGPDRLRGRLPAGLAGLGHRLFRGLLAPAGRAVAAYRGA